MEFYIVRVKIYLYFSESQKKKLFIFLFNSKFFFSFSWFQIKFTIIECQTENCIKCPDDTCTVCSYPYYLYNDS